MYFHGKNLPLQAKISTENKTTVLIYWNYWNFLRYFGIFPVKLSKVVNESNGEIQILFKVLSSGPWFWYFIITFILVQVNTGIQLYNFIAWNIEKESERYVSLPCLGWAIYSAATTLVTIQYSKNKKYIGIFLTEWQKLEQSEYEEENLNSDQRERKFKRIESEFKYLSWIMVFVIFLCLCCLTTNFVGYSGWSYPIYWYSRISLYIQSNELKYTTFILQLLSTGVIMGWGTLFQIPCYAVSHSMTYYIKNISCPNPSPDSKIDEVLFEESLRKYEIAATLVKNFNWMFRWLLLGFKFISAIEICIFVYIIIRFKLNDVSFGVTMISYYLSLLFILQVSTIVSSMGNLYGETQGFIESWKYGILPIYDKLRPELRRKLKQLKPFGFQVGKFYFVQPTTILTLLSVITTYLIVLLQA